MSRCSRHHPGRAGFTLIEMLIASGLGIMVMAIVMQAYFGANKAQALAIGVSALKTGGQRALNELYTSLHQNRHLFDRNAVTQTFLGRTPIYPYQSSGPDYLSPGLPSPDPNVDLTLPLVRETGVLAKDTLSVPGDITALEGAVGNALFFASVEPQVILDDSGDNVLQTTFGTAKYHLGVTRLHFYFLARRELPALAPTVRTGATYTYHLMYWKSKPYLDYQDVTKWMGLIMDSTATNKDTYIDTKLAALGAKYTGALNLSSVDGSLASITPAVYDLTALDAARRDLQANTTDRFKTEKFTNAIDFGMKSSYGEPMVAFNTTGTGAVAISGLDVPAFANDADTHPFGFEVMVVGTQDSRKVMLRLALAARTHTGRVFVGQVFQQVVHIYEYGGGT